MQSQIGRMDEPTAERFVHEVVYRGYFEARSVKDDEVDGPHGEERRDQAGKTRDDPGLVRSR